MNAGDRLERIRQLLTRHPAPPGKAGCEPYQEVRHVSWALPRRSGLHHGWSSHVVIGTTWMTFPSTCSSSDSSSVMIVPSSNPYAFIASQSPPNLPRPGLLIVQGLCHLDYLDHGPVRPDDKITFVPAFVILYLFIPFRKSTTYQVFQEPAAIFRKCTCNRMHQAGIRTIHLLWVCQLLLYRITRLHQGVQEKGMVLAYPIYSLTESVAIGKSRAIRL